MTDKTQILDVTFGTFSCRLEGFDDSLATMKLVVGYFHDLAGHAQFLNTAQPAPDLAELARLTQAAADGDVQTTVAGGKLRLRLRETPQSAAAPDLASDAMEDTFYDESVAARLDRVRNVVGRGHAPETKAPDTEDLTDSAAAQDGQNPLALRLAALARRNAERAALQADLARAQPAPDAAQDSAAAPPDAPQPQAPETKDKSLHLANLVADDGLDLHAEVAEIGRVIEDRNKRYALSHNADDAISRILSHTDAALNQPEHRRQQDAFAQLKAAVAATEAARQLGDDGSPQHRPSEAYRHDLGEFAAAADPQDPEQDTDQDANQDGTAPTGPAARANDPAGGQRNDPAAPPRNPPPLRLVASQRADISPEILPDPASQRLRQIAAKARDAAQPVMRFAQFADEYAATDLEDQIEAAAAYISFVMAQADFSRPQVMKLVQSLTQSEISREDGLRCFGRLLRKNRIIKLDNGRFTVASSTRFRQDT